MIEQPRPLHHDDILILARTKVHLAAYETALRRAGIPFTPAGRGLLARSREVQDLLALLRWLAYPADDTAGATVLRSPCFRLPEATVQDLLVRRRAGARRSLREVLRGADEAALAWIRDNTSRDAVFLVGCDAAYAGSVCSPSRAMLTTGMYTSRIGYSNNTPGGPIRHRMEPSTVPRSLETPMNSRIRSLTSSRP